MALGRLQREGLEVEKIVIFHLFYSVCTLSMHLALGLMDLELGGSHDELGNGTCQFYCSFILFFELVKREPARTRKTWGAIPLAPGEG